MSNMIKYEATWNNEIKSVEIQRETDKCVWINGRRRDKAGSFFDTWDAAKSYLLIDANKDLLRARRSLELAQSRYGNIKGLRETHD